ncbi:hypothetical protein QEG98_06520 [Myxococcus sp. MxC21-1]|uniref:hypothetical protein n=1 Tax=Myxococcus sp. MxC21-1 TaxID=3041439 RepID=UPI00292DAAA4|nr:hypothetical protein [Myxococcus sp. MxC21-1]WNZ63392.1 hypothetical protein QEG98_06520 [Myxococcus sp. MxC21-1]
MRLPHAEVQRRLRGPRCGLLGRGGTRLRGVGQCGAGMLRRGGTGLRGAGAACWGAATG